jgi:membrane fusion protein, multidrug efflux system
MKSWKLWLALAVVAAVVIGAVMLLKSRGPVVETAAVFRGDVVDAVYATGEAAAIERAEVSPEVGGRVTEVLVDEGDSVAVGAVLARIETTAVEFNRTMVTEQINRARSAWEQARKDRGRYANLLDQKVIAPQEYEVKMRAEEQASADLKRLEASLASETDRVGRAEIKSPLAGVVVKRRVDPGDYAVLAVPLFTVIAPGSLRIVVNVDETEVVDIQAGQSVRVALDAFPGQRFSGEVERIVPRIDKMTRTGEVRIKLGETLGALREGMSATVNIVVREVKAALLVPREAVTMTEDRAWVYTVADGKIQRVEFAPGAYDEHRVEVKSGPLTEGAAVVRNPAEALADGMKVKVKSK